MLNPVLAEQLRAHAAVRARIQAPREIRLKTKPSRPLCLSDAACFALRGRETSTQPYDANAHVAAYRCELLRLAGAGPRYEPKAQAARVLKAAAQVSGFGIEDILSESRRSPLPFFRHCAMWIVRRHVPGATWPLIGRVFNREHSTAVTRVQAIDQRLREPGVTATIEQIAALAGIDLSATGVSRETGGAS